MQQIVNFLIIATVLLCYAQAKVHLKKGVSSTVAFVGDDLTMEVGNSRNQRGLVKLCFGSSADASTEFCPKGYAAVVLFVNENRLTTLKLNRLGAISPVGLTISQKAKFEDDGTVRVLVADMPSGVSVTLPNAEIPVITTTTTTLAPNNGSSRKATVLILFATVLIVVIIIVGTTVCYFCFCRRNKRKTVAVLEEPLPSRPKRTDQRVDNPNVGARKQPSAITATRTSTSTTKVSQEKQRVDPAPKPPPSDPIANKIDYVSIRPALTQGSISDSQNH